MKMPPRQVKKCVRLQNQNSLLNVTEKENIYTRLRKRNQNKSPQKQKLDDSEEFEKLLLPAQDQEIDSKCTGFWSKKLKDLDRPKDILKKKNELYEFETDDSTSPSIKKKKQRKKYTRKKKDECPTSQLNLNTKKNPVKVKKHEEHQRSLVREQIMINREKEKLAVNDEKFTFSTNLNSLGVTSTPASKKINVIGASNFMFISPVAKEENVTHLMSELDESKGEISCVQSKTPKMVCKNKILYD